MRFGVSPPAAPGADSDSAAGLAPSPGGAPPRAPARPPPPPSAGPARGVCHSQRLGPGSGRAGRSRSRRDVSGGKGPLEQVFEIGALAILHVIDMPGSRRRILDAPFQT